MRGAGPVEDGKVGGVGRTPKVNREQPGTGEEPWEQEVPWHSGRRAFPGRRVSANRALRDVLYGGREQGPEAVAAARV